MAGPGDRGYNPQQPAAHPRMGAGLPPGPGGGQRQEGQEGMLGAAQEMAGQVGDKAREYASSAAQQAERAWEGTRREFEQGYSALATCVQDFWTDTTGLIRTYPVASVLLAFGVGCLVAGAVAATPHPFSGTDDVARRMSRASA